MKQPSCKKLLFFYLEYIKNKNLFSTLIIIIIFIKYHDFDLDDEVFRNNQSYNNHILDIF